MADVYSVDTRGKKRKKWRRRILWFLLLLIFIVSIVALVIYIREQLKPKVVIKQAAATKSYVAYNTKTKHYDEGDFGIDILLNWQNMPRAVGPYKTFTWQTSDSGTNGQVITIYEDTIPANFAVNRVMIVRGETDHLVEETSPSENCSKYTKGTTTAQYQVGVPAKWQDVDFLCDQSNKQRDIIGTSSLDGVNTVILKGGTSGTHKFFFTYSSYNVANPDYTPFTDALNSLRMN